MTSEQGDMEIGRVLSQKAVSPTLPERLNARIEDAKSTLQDLERAKIILERNPQMAELLNILSRTNIR